MESIAIWQDDYIIHSYDSDYQKKAKITTICNYFQDSAWKHAENLGWGFQRLLNENKMWLLVRLSLLVKRYPVWSEAIRLQTWPKGTEGLIALRDFEVTSQTGETLVAGTSAWIIADITTRRPQRLENFNMPFSKDKHALEKKPEKITEAVNAKLALAFNVLLSDLDANFHVNNVKFIEWIIDSVPFETWKDKTILSFDINYLSEARVGDAIAIQHDSKPDGLFVSVFATSQSKNVKETCRAKIVFQD
jgi:medium-chain acyl-[acyl-carrier-protein] hydrolase